MEVRRGANGLVGIDDAGMLGLEWVKSNIGSDTLKERRGGANGVEVGATTGFKIGMLS